MQFPLQHRSLKLHRIPHPPQWVSFDKRSVQVLPQRVVPLRQAIMFPVAGPVAAVALFPPKSEAKKFPMEAMRSGGGLSAGTGVVVFRSTTGTGPSAGGSGGISAGAPSPAKTPEFTRLRT